MQMCRLAVTNALELCAVWALAERATSNFVALDIESDFSKVIQVHRCESSFAQSDQTECLCLTWCCEECIVLKSYVYFKVVFLVSACVGLQCAGINSGWRNRARVLEKALHLGSS